MTDEQLLREMRKGNQEALQQMIQRYHRYLTTIIGNILGSGGSREDIEELVQDTFYAVWNHAGKFGARSSPIFAPPRETGPNLIYGKIVRSCPAGIWWRCLTS